MIPEEKRWFEITFKGSFFGVIKEVKEDETDLLQYISKIISSLKQKISDTKLEEPNFFNHLKITDINIIENPNMYKLKCK